MAVIINQSGFRLLRFSLYPSRTSGYKKVNARNDETLIILNIMAKQKGFIKLKGSLGGLTFYQADGQDVVRTTVLLFVAIPTQTVNKYNRL